MSQSHTQGQAEASQSGEGAASDNPHVIDGLVADLGKAATLAEWIYAGLRIETRDWSAELRKSAEVGLPELAVFDNGENTGSIVRGEADAPQTMAMQRGSSAYSVNTESTLDAMVAGVLEAKVIGVSEGQKTAAASSQSVIAQASEPMSQAEPMHVVYSKATLATQPAIEATVIETPVVDEPVEEISGAIIAELPVIEPVEAVIETPAIEIPVLEIPVLEIPVLEIPVLETPVLETPVLEIPVLETPVLETPVLETPLINEPVKAVIEETITATEQPPLNTAGEVFGFGLGSGRIYVTDFDAGIDSIAIRADLFTSYEEMIERAGIYQDGASAVIELHNGADMIIMPHFSIKNISADIFTFEAAAKTELPTPVVDRQFGSEDNDTLVFGAGDQIIDPGQGFDVVTGGEGHDTFVFGATSGHDFIVDFRSGEDTIQIGESLAADFDGLLESAAIYQEGNSTQIEFSGGQLLTLYGVDAKQISTDWFAFA